APMITTSAIVISPVDAAQPFSIPYAHSVRLLPRLPYDQDVADAREALAFWHGRHARLAWHRRAARREARDHIARWHGHLHDAQLRRFGLDDAHPMAPVVGWLALPRGEQARRVGSMLMRTRAVRRVQRLLVVSAAAIAGLFALAAVGIA